MKYAIPRVGRRERKRCKQSGGMSGNGSEICDAARRECQTSKQSDERCGGQGKGISSPASGRARETKHAIPTVARRERKEVSNPAACQAMDTKYAIRRVARREWEWNPASGAAAKANEQAIWRAARPQRQRNQHSGELHGRNRKRISNPATDTAESGDRHCGKEKE